MKIKLKILTEVLKNIPKQPIATFCLKSRLPYNTTYGRATQAVCAHWYQVIQNRLYIEKSRSVVVNE